MLIIPNVILAIESGDDRAYMTAVYKQYSALMLKIARSFTPVQADVEDIVSDSCASLITHLETIRSMECFELRAYIAATVRNTAMNHCRKQKRASMRFQHVDDEAILQIPDTVSVEKKIMLRDEIECVRKVIHTLPEHERDVLRLKYQQGLKDKEIAEAVGLAEASVRKYVERARKRLKAAVY